MDIAITTNNLTKIYTYNNMSTSAINNINTVFYKEEITAIIGKSGSGKSTLLHLLGGLDIPTQGEVIIDNTSIYTLKDNILSNFRSRNIGFIFQKYNLLNELTAMENIRLSSNLANIEYDPKYEKEIIDLLDLKDRLNYYPYQLSGGQQQKVAIARALLNKPSFILADEPTGNLDSKSGNDFMNFILKTNIEFKQTYIIVTHNLDLTNYMHRVITLEDGIIINDKRIRENI